MKVAKMSTEGLLTTSEAIDAYLATLNLKSALALAQAVREVRASLPGCVLTDRELAEILAAQAICQGFAVIIFDLDAKRFRMELAVN
jgi:hypothetical protein